jgi:hypothetical protein
MSSSVLHFKKAQFNVLTNEETELVSGGVIIVGFAIGIAAVALVGAVAAPVVYKDLKNVYDTNYERGYREEEYKYRTK